MSWLKEKNCPICGRDEFDPDCDEVDIGVGIQQGNYRGLCKECGEVVQCECGMWLSRDSDHHCEAGQWQK